MIYSTGGDGRWGNREFQSTKSQKNFPSLQSHTNYHIRYQLTLGPGLVPYFHCHTFSLYFPPIVEPRKLLNEVQIAAICALVNQNNSKKELSADIGLSLCSVQCWTRKYCMAESSHLPHTNQQELGMLTHQRRVSHI